MPDVRQRLDDARYFLGRMDAEVHGDGFKPNLSAFLDAYRSVTFRIEHAIRGNSALETWYRGELQGRGFPCKQGQRWLPGSDPVLDLLKRLRDVDIHERAVPLHSQASLTVQASISLSGELHWRRIGPDGRAVEAGVSDPTPATEPSPRQTQVQRRWFFNELPSYEVNTACRYAVNQLEGLVQACEAQGIS